MSEVTGCFANLLRSRKDRATAGPVKAAAATGSVYEKRAQLSEPVPSLTSNNKPHHAIEPCCCTLDGETRRPDHKRDLDSAPPPAYSTGSLPKETYALLQKEIAHYAAGLKELSLYLHDNPELGYEEFKAHAKITSYLEEQGFKVDKHFAGLKTAWRVVWTNGKGLGQGGRVFGLNSEFDALPGVGHACGHNLICVAGIASLLAMRAVMSKHNIEGTIILLGTPAEEGGEGKLKLLKAGAYDDMDVCMMTHPDAQPAGEHSVLTSLAIQSIWVEYRGKTAQASAQPWEGINALDAVHLAYGAISAVRQQLQPTWRVHGIITHGGDAANIIPDFCSMKYYVRAPTAKEVDELKAKVLPCFESAAAATGCSVKITLDEMTLDQRNNSVLADAYAAAVHDMFGTYTEIDLTGRSFGGGGKASTDFGNVTYALPACHANFGIPTKRANHTPEFATAAGTDEAHEETWKSAAGLAATGIRVLMDAGFTKDAKEWFKQDHKGEKF